MSSKSFSTLIFLVCCGLGKERPQEGHNSFTRAICAACDAGQQSGFDANLEWDSRYKEKKNQYK